MSSPTAEDARLLVQLARWGTALGIEEVLPSLLDESFDPDIADAMADRPVRTMLMFGESVGTLVKHGLLNDELVHDWLWVEGIWSRVGPAAVRLRERLDEPRLYENFEALAARRG
ncbi:MAG TPA: hypothetical protein VLZ06_07720 [Solirubrobacteraceae bacterium]|nr:hypothetical protein [Solirubrobacteraceae bacterium]